MQAFSAAEKHRATTILHMVPESVPPLELGSFHSLLRLPLPLC